MISGFCDANFEHHLREAAEIMSFARPAGGGPQLSAVEAYLFAAPQQSSGGLGSAGAKPASRSLRAAGAFG